MVLCMNHGRQAESPSCDQNIQDLPIVQLQWVICHVELDTGDTHFLHNSRQFVIQDFLGWIGQDEMESIVAGGPPTSKLGIVLDNRDNARVGLFLRRKCQYRGRAATDSAACCGVPSITVS